MTNSPFSKDYRPRLDWGAQNLDKQRGETVAKHLEKSRLKDPAHDMKTGLTLSERDQLMPKHFHVYSKAVPSTKGKNT